MEDWVTKRIGILTGGGDVPGLNPCIKAIVLGAKEREYTVFGIRRGWRGLLHYDLNNPLTQEYCVRELDELDVRTIDRTGGTFLHTSRTNPQNVKDKDIPEFLKTLSYGKLINNSGLRDYTDYILEVLNYLNIDILITIGGDDTLSYSSRLIKEGFPTIGIPKTMDNDVYGTDYCIGFSTAITRSIDLITNMRSSVGSHERIGIVELFGRSSGETCLVSAFLTQVDRAIIPEVPFNVQRLADHLLEDKRRNPSNYAIMTISEGAKLEGGRIVEKGAEDDYGHRKLGGIGDLVSDEIKRITGQNTMYQKLGYLMRSGPPDSLDRMVAMCFGNLTVKLIEDNESGKMVALQNGNYTTFPLDEVPSKERHVDVKAYYDVNNYRPKIFQVLGTPMFLS